MQYVLQTLNYWPFLLRGLWWTLGVSALSMVFGFLLGVITAPARDSRIVPLRIVAGIYVDVVRIVPLFVLLLWIYYALPLITGWSLTGVQAGVLGMSLAAGASLTEVIRAGIHSVEAGQREAAEALGMNRRQSLVRVVLPQAFSNMLPAIGNNLVVTLKATSLLSVVAVPDLLRSAQTVSGVLQREFEPLAVAAFVYLLITLPISLGVAAYERRRRVRV